MPPKKEHSDSASLPRQKQIRMDPDIVTMLEEFRKHFGDVYTDDTKLLMMMIRSYAPFLATEATSPLGKPYAGYDPNVIVARIGPKVLHYVNFLVEHGWNPPMLTALFGGTHAPSIVPPDRPLAEETPDGIIFDDTAAEDAGNLGFGLFDDDV